MFMFYTSDMKTYFFMEKRKLSKTLVSVRKSFHYASRERCMQVHEEQKILWYPPEVIELSTQT